MTGNMAPTLVFLLQLLLMVSLASASHHFGGRLTFDHIGNDKNGSFLVELRSKATFYGCGYPSWSCNMGNCGSTLASQNGIIDTSTNGPRRNTRWCETERVLTLKVPNDKPFALRRASCCWISTANNIGSWRLLTHVDLGTRSDTRQPNRSPHHGVLPFLRVPTNCRRSYKIMAVDSDGDQVRCRYGTTRGTECNGCNQPAGFQLDEGSCTLHYGYTAHNGVYGFELVVEDFPTHSITLSYTDGSQTTRLPLTKKRAKRQYVTSTTSPYWWLRTTTAYTATTPLSKLPLQFSLLVDSAAPSCQEGQYLPKFLSPTPRNEERLHAEATKEIVIRVKAQASYATIDDIIISGPLNVTKHKNTHGEFAIKWTPATRDLGDHFPICFIVEAANGSALYQSEMRCVLVEVEKPGVKADVICTETTMTVQVDKSTFPRLSENHLRLNDPSNTVCSLQQHSNQTHVIAVIPLNACGTQIEEDDINLMFKNEITTVDSPGSLITRKHLLEVEFYCQYPKHGNVSLGFSAHRRNVTVTEKGFGTFTYRFEFYEDNHFGRIVDPSTYPLEFEVGDSIYMGIEATSSVNNTELFVESCSAAPYDIPNYRPTYPIFVNGCTADPTVQIFAPGHKKEFHFGMEAFKFIGQHEQVYISCSVIICEAGNPNTRCSKGCLKSTSAGPHRRKRAAVIETGAHFISQGPLRLRKTPESRVTGLNLNMVFIVGSLLAAFGMVCGVLIYKAKRSTVKYQPLSSTEH